MRFRSRGTERSENLLRRTRRGTLLFVAAAALLLLWRLQQMTNPPTPDSNLSKTPPASSLLSDEFRVVQDPAAPRFQNPDNIINSQAAAALERQTDPTSGPDDLPVALTAGIQDDVLGVLAAEKDAFFGTLKLADRVFAGRRDQMPEGRYAVLIDSPENARGRPLKIRGRLRRLTQAVLPEESRSYGIRRAWDAWISTPDSGNQLVHVIALAADQGLPIGDSLGKNGPDVEFAGYLFKREGYAAKGQDGSGELALAPLILSDRIIATAAVTVVTRADELNPWLTWLAALIFAGVLLSVLQFRLADRAFLGSRTHQLTTPPVRPTFEGLDSLTTRQMLQQLEEIAGDDAPDTSLLS